MNDLAICEQATLGLDEAVGHLMRTVVPIADQEMVSLSESMSRTLASDIKAGISLPPFDNSAMDGYAFNTNDFPAFDKFQCIDKALAGRPASKSWVPGSCIQIMTGAMLPNGFDCVIPQESISHEGGAVISEFQPKLGANVRRAGEDISLGAVAMPAGTKINPARVALLAALGIEKISVLRKPRALILSTGDELVAPGESLLPGQIYNSNEYMLHALLSTLPVYIDRHAPVNDDPAEIDALLSDADGKYDVIISTGGVSVGTADYMKAAFSKLGNIEFWKIKIKPGKPVAFGKLKQSYLLGLPGNPVSAAVCFEKFALPLLDALMGAKMATTKKEFRAILKGDIKRRAGREEFQRGILTYEDDSWTVCSAGPQGSAMLASMASANCLICIPAESEYIAAGSLVKVEPDPVMFR